MKLALRTGIVALVLLVAVTTHAQESEWSWSVTPYGWLAGMEGDTGVGELVAPLEVEFSDVLDALSFGAMVSADGNNGRWGVLGDLFYVALDDSQQTALGTIESEVEQWTITAAPYYRVLSDGCMVVDIGAGARYMDIAVDLSTPRQNRSGSQSWVDPLVFARVQIPIAEKINLSLTGEIGGFGLESDFTWHVAAIAGYAITEKVDFLFGYRHMDIDHEDGDFVYDVATSGLALGVSIGL